MATRMLEQNLTDIAVHGSILPNKVFVGGLAEQTETKDLRDMFSAYGPVQDVKIIVDRSVTSKSGDPRRYAFIAFDSVEDVKNVLAELNEKSLDLHGRRLTVGQAYRKGPCTRLIAAGYPGADMNSAMFRAAFNNLAYQRAFQPGQPSPYPCYYGYMDPVMGMMPQPISPGPGGMMMPMSYPGAMAPPSSPGGSGMMSPNQMHCHGSQMNYPSGPGYSKNLVITGMQGMPVSVQGNTNGSNGNQCPADDQSDNYYKNINAQQDMQFQMLSERLRNAVAPRVLGVSQPFRVQQSNQQQPPSPAHYIHQGPTQVPTGGSYIAPAVRQYAQ